MKDADVIVVGAGPAGVSASRALVERGLHVLLVDAGDAAPMLKPPFGALTDLARADDSQWKWRLGEGFEGLRQGAGASPKMRIPNLVKMLDGFSEKNRITATNFRVIGALAAGGLTNAWGCGVARFSVDELSDLAFVKDAMDRSYAAVAKDMGLSGKSDDELGDYFGVDEWCSEALPLDSLRDFLWARRKQLPSGTNMGRPRLAVRSGQGRGTGCDLSGMCMWGCARNALWSASQWLELLKGSSNFGYLPGHLVARVNSGGGGWKVDAICQGQEVRTLSASSVVLAAGTIATSRLAFSALGQVPEYAKLQSSPVAAFMLATPKYFGRAPDNRFFGLGQLALTLDDEEARETALAFLVSPIGLPISEFVPYMPLPPRAALEFLRATICCFSVGNVFFPGTLSDHQISLDEGGGLHIQGAHSPRLASRITRTRKTLQLVARRLGSWLVPSSLNVAEPGADIHYAGTLPCKVRPRFGECGLDGQLKGLPPGLFIADGAALPSLPAKSHTMTIMANADRIGRELSAPDIYQRGRSP